VRTLIVNTSVETVGDILQKTLLILVRNRVFHIGRENVSIHYLDYTLGVVPVLTSDFSPTNLGSSPFCRGRSVSNPQHVHFIKF
jgi:hypothetical protein